MKNPYAQFKEYKNADKLAKIKARSQLTLEYYEKIGRLLDDEAFEYCRDYLLSVSEYIESKEIITDGQIEAVDNIINAHQDYNMGYQYKNHDNQPF